MTDYNFKNIEKKWQEKWQADKTFQVTDNTDKEKFYILDMFPYPSGDGLHVGHPKGYVATDVVARYMMLQGKNVLHPMGFDSFGLPAENYAIKNKVHPQVAVTKNIKRFKDQLSQFGFTYDWDREIITSDPSYYRWTQWIFLQMFKSGLAYESNEPINWCPSCKTGLANEDLEDGKCERCGTIVEKKPIRQWVLKMTAYADRLLKDLSLVNWEKEIIEQQINWIGKSTGHLVTFSIANSKTTLTIFTTRIDTIFGATYMVVAPEHDIISSLKSQISNIQEIKHYQQQAKNKSDLERTDLAKEKTGVEIKGIKAINPANGQEIPIFVADYVLPHYGTGAIMAVPAHDERDHEFAIKYNLPIINVVHPTDAALCAYYKIEPTYLDDSIKSQYQELLEDKNLHLYTENKPKVFIDKGFLVNSSQFNGLDSDKAKIQIAEKLNATQKTNYKMRDWVFSRQRYWGEPIPVIHCDKCGIVPVPEKDLPVTLPDVKSYEPTGTGESPLANISDWVNTTCPKCGAPAKRETNTMPQWAGSCWYYLRYIDSRNTHNLVDPAKEKYWMQPHGVDLYVGGAEHATRHLLYARFWHKFLYDIGVVTTKEPFYRLQHVGLIRGSDERKMSKRWGNVVNPDEVIAEFGADAFRMYEMFMGPFADSVAWNTAGVKGTKRFLDKVWHYYHTTTPQDTMDNEDIQQAINKVSTDIINFNFNTAISQLMIAYNKFSKSSISKTDLEKFLIILSPFAPHITEELWLLLGHKDTIFHATWPASRELSAQITSPIPVIVNGKKRAVLDVADAKNITQQQILDIALANKHVKQYATLDNIHKIIYVPAKILSIVVKQ